MSDDASFHRLLRDAGAMAAAPHRLSTTALLLFLYLGICTGDVSADVGRDEGVKSWTLDPSSTTCFESKVPMNALKVVHRFGPCSPFDDAPPDVELTLRLDSQRVAYLQERAGITKNAPGNVSTDSLQQSLHHVVLAARYGNSIGAPGYVVTIGMGSPKTVQTIVFDTASVVGWIQCQPCQECFHQVDAIFRPMLSKTYKRVPCADPACSHLPPGTMRCVNKVCNYNISYGPSAFTTGTLSRDTLELRADPNVDVPRFVFGCSHSSVMGMFKGAAGVLGLGIGYNSVVTQTSNIYEHVFSYCLPSLTNAVGYLNLGKKEDEHSSTPTSYTPMLQNPHTGLNLYHIDLKGISVDNVRLAPTPVIFQIAGTVIDSQVIISRIPAMAYVELRMSFRTWMARHGHQLSHPVGILDTCYNIISRATFQYPSITLHFEGVDLPLSFAQTFQYVDHDNSMYCLGFAPSGTTGTVSVLGTLQQRGMEVIYNVGEGKIGFSRGGHCL